MAEKIKTRWYSGKDILRCGIKDFELLAAVKKGDLTPYDEDSGKKVVAPHALQKRRQSLAEIKKELTTRISQYPGLVASTKVLPLTRDVRVKAKQIYENDKPEIPDCPQDCMIDDFIAENIMDYIYKADEVEAFINEINHDLVLKGQQAETILKAGLEKKDNNVNSFINKGDYWEIKFDGKSEIVKNLAGIRYIATLLERPGKSISCRELFQFVSGKAPGKVMSESAAINEGLNIGGNTQPISDDKATQGYWNQWQKLQDDIDNAEDSPEGEILKKESMKKQSELMPHLKKRNFADPNDKKAQANISKRLDTAYKTISETGMKEMAKHLQDNIKTNDAYGLRYTGDIAWNIIIK